MSCRNRGFVFGAVWTAGTVLLGLAITLAAVTVPFGLFMGTLYLLGYHP
jgi:hypothetical protein